MVAGNAMKVFIIAGEPSGDRLGGALMAGFKSAVTKGVNEMLQTPGVKLWQRNYYERVIRNEKELCAVRKYIQDNPFNWNEDKDNPENN